MDDSIPQTGQWPADPQEEQSMLDSRIWIDGVFDFFHHGHAGVMLQARQLGTELYVGIHSDEAVLEHKGPTVMNLKERILAATANRWTTWTIPSAPYVTSLPWITHYGCRYVVHGDDISSDSSGADCYRYVKAAGRFKVVRRTPGISTTDLVGRMLLLEKGHHVRGSVKELLEGSGDHGREGQGERQRYGKEVEGMMKAYASDETGLAPGVEVWDAAPPQTSAQLQRPTGSTSTSTSSHETHPPWNFHALVAGTGPQKGQRIVYVDGGFDLFSSGHIAFLRDVVAYETSLAQARSNRHASGSASATPEPPCYVIAGMHSDAIVNAHKGLNYPVMNIVERGLCVLQCKYINAVIFDTPYTPTEEFLRALPYGLPDAVYHGSTPLSILSQTPTPNDTASNPADPYAAAKSLGLFTALPPHEFSGIDAEHIVSRILGSRERFEERQRRKLGKGLVEEEVKRMEVSGMEGH